MHVPKMTGRQAFHYCRCALLKLWQHAAAVDAVMLFLSLEPAVDVRVTLLSDLQVAVTLLVPFRATFPLLLSISADVTLLLLLLGPVTLRIWFCFAEIFLSLYVRFRKR